MAELNDSLDLAKKLEWAAPITSEHSQEANLSSSYLSWDSNNAFLSNMSIDNQISEVSEMADETMQQAVDSGLITRQEDIEAERQRELAEAKAKAEAEAKIKAEIAAKEREKARAERAEQFIEFLQWKSKKDKVLWYSRWVITWFLLALSWVFVAMFFFKQQTIDFVSKDFTDYIQNDSFISVKQVDKILHISETFKLTDNELVNKIIKPEDISFISEIALSNYLGDSFLGEMLKVSAIDIDTSVQPMNQEKDTETKESTSNDENDSNEIEEEWTRIVETEILEENTENTKDTTAITNYQITYTNDESTANRVIANNCSELSCGDYTKAANPDEIVLCTKFKQQVNLSDDDVRISKSGACRYKDESELAFLDLNWDNELTENDDKDIQETDTTISNDTITKDEPTKILE